MNRGKCDAVNNDYMGMVILPSETTGIYLGDGPRISSLFLSCTKHS